MISEAKAKAQIARLAHIDGFPWETAGIEDLVKALMDCPSDEEAVGIIDEIVHNTLAGQKCPYVADLRRLVYDVNQANPRTSRCPICHGEGFVYEWRLRWTDRSADTPARRQRPVADQAAGYREADNLPPGSDPLVSETTVSCPCRKPSRAPAPARELARAGGRA